MNFGTFSPKTLKNIVNSAKVLNSCPRFRTVPLRDIANKEKSIILTRESLEGIIELQKYDIVVGIESDRRNVPYEIRNLTHRPIKINHPTLTFKTPIFSKVLAQTPINVVPGGGSNLLVVTLPDFMIEQCGSWWNLVDSEHEHVIISDVLRIKYNSVNVLNTFLEKQY